MHLKQVLILLSCMVFLVSCKSDPVAPDKELTINGVVKDVSGNTVAGAYLNFTFQLSPVSSSLHREYKPDETMPSTSIAFSIPGRSHVRVTIENYVHQYVLTLVDDTLNGGAYVIAWNGKDGSGKALYSDCYFYRLTVSNDATVKKLLFVVDQHLATNPAVYAQTDPSGRFSIPLSRIPVNEIFVRTNASGEVIESLKLSTQQRLYGFTESRYGTETVSLNGGEDITIILSAAK